MARQLFSSSDGLSVSMPAVPKEVVTDAKENHIETASNQTAPTEDGSLFTASSYSCNISDAHLLSRYDTDHKRIGELRQRTLNEIQGATTDTNKIVKRLEKNLARMEKNIAIAANSKDAVKTRQLMDTNAQLQKEVAMLRKEIDTMKRGNSLSDLSNQRIKANRGRKLHPKVKASKKHDLRHSSKNKENAVAKNRENANAVGHMDTKKEILARALGSGNNKPLWK